MMERGICGRISTTSTLCGGLCAHDISWEDDEVEEMLLCEERSPSSSDMEPSRIGGPKNSPDGTVEVIEEVHGIAGGDEDSSGSWSKVEVMKWRPLDSLRDLSVPVLWAVEGLPFLIGVRLFALRKPDAHHSSRSSAMEEALELL